MTDFWRVPVIDAPCADCKKEGRDRLSQHTARNGDPVCNTHYLQRMRVSAATPTAATEQALEGAAKDVLSALMNLGYDKVRAQTALAKVQSANLPGMGSFEVLMRETLAVLKNHGVGSAAAFLANPEAIEADHAARTGQAVQSVHRRPKPKPAVEDYVDRTVATSHGGQVEDEDMDAEFGDDEEKAEERPMKTRHDVDWTKAQNDRSDGLSVEDIAKKHSTTVANVYAHTRKAATAPNSVARAGNLHAARASSAETRRAAPAVAPRPAATFGVGGRTSGKVTGGHYDTVLAELRDKREQLNQECTRVDAAIEALEAIA